MDAPRVIVCRSDLGMGSESVERLLSGIPSIEVAFVDKPELSTELAREASQVRAEVGAKPFKVLITQAGAHNDAELRGYLRQYPDMGIIVFDIRGEDAVVRLRLHHVGRDMLARLIHAVSDRQQSGAPEGARIHVLRNEDIERMASAGSTGGEMQSYSDSAEHLADVKRWLDLSLGALLAEEDKDQTGSQITGWGLSVAQARALLGPDIQHWPAAILREKARAQEALIVGRELASLAHGFCSRLMSIANAFELDRREIRLLWHALAAELDGRYTRVHGVLNDDLTRRRPTLTRLAQLEDRPSLAWPARQWFDGNRLFALHRLIHIETEPTHGISAAPDDCVALVADLVQFLLSDDGTVPDYGGGIALLPAGDANERETGSREPAGELCDVMAIAPERRPVLQLNRGIDARRWFEKDARAAGLAVLRVNLAGQSDPARLQRAIESWCRIATLHQAALLIVGFERQAGEPHGTRWANTDLADRVPLLVFQGPLREAIASTAHRPIRPLKHDKLKLNERARIWRQQAEQWGLVLPQAEAEKLASTVRFDETDIAAAIRIAAGATKDPATDDDVAAIRAAVRRMARELAPAAVRVVETVFGWNDVVLPADILGQIKSIPDHVEQRELVFEQWGYERRMPYGQGVAALFAGPSGSGKTMSAQILARELGVELFHVDLSKVISKYIGETEKNLDWVFDCAENASAVLLFDEADALFGKRTEVKDAHDRYANVEVAYLLQRMESYNGLAILTTNLKQNLDSAFLRRLRFMVDFPTPGPEDRLKIWNRALPKDAPRAPNVDFGLLARRLTLTGGNIQNILLGAGFAAAASGGVITMQHILHATRQELLKLGMLSAERSLAEMTIEREPAAQEARA